MKKIKKKIYYGSQFIEKDDIDYVAKSLRNNFLTTGPLTTKFENNLKKYLKVKFAHTCNSGTSALFLALLSIDIKKGDKVILPSVNFVAAANMSKFLGAKIYFADINPLTGQSEPEDIIRCIQKNKIKKIKAIIVMFNGGYPRNVKKIYDIKKKFKCFLIEDACHALGSSYLHKGRKLKIGSCFHSDISTFSLHPLKTITTFEGGIITTNKKDISNKIKLFRSHGIVRKKNYWEYDVQELGFNLRLSDVASALGISQLKKISKIIHIRKNIFNFYHNNLHNFKNLIRIIKPEEKTIPSYHLLLVIINFDKLKINKNRFLKLLIKQNIFCQFHYIPNYKYRQFKDFPNLNGAEKFYKLALSLPIHLNLKKKDLNFVVKNIKQIFTKYIKYN